MGRPRPPFFLKTKVWELRRTWSRWEPRPAPVPGVDESLVRGQRCPGGWSDSCGPTPRQVLWRHTTSAREPRPTGVVRVCFARPGGHLPHQTPARATSDLAPRLLHTCWVSRRRESQDPLGAYALQKCPPPRPDNPSTELMFIGMRDTLFLAQSFHLRPYQEPENLHSPNAIATQRNHCRPEKQEPAGHIFSVPRGLSDWLPSFLDILPWRLTLFS